MASTEAAAATSIAAASSRRWRAAKSLTRRSSAYASSSDPGNLSGDVFGQPNVRRKGDEVGAETGELGGFFSSVDVPGDARHHENLRPPGDQPGAFLPLAAGKRGGGTECNIIRTKLRQQHGVMTTFVATNAYDRALT